MEIINLENLERSISFSRIYGLDQLWPDGKKWSCVGEPRDEHGFLYIFCESVMILYKGETEPLTFHRGDLVYIPKNSEYTIEFKNTKGDCSSILINFDICDTKENECYLAERVCRIANNIPPKLADIMLNLVQHSKNLAHPTIAVSKAFYELLDKLVGHLLATRLHNTEKDSVLPAIFYMDSHVLDDVSVPQLAQMCLLNESAFRKAFKEHTGMNPVQYKMQVKINKAKLLLRSGTDIPIESIAESLGFYDNAYFHKVFVKCTGKTPKQYRDAHR